jgi:hypothetical protein
MSDGDTNAAVVRLWAEATAGMIDVAQAFWNGLLNLNPVERNTDSAVGEGRTSVPVSVATAPLRTTPFVDAHNQPMAVAAVDLSVDPVEAGATSVDVHVTVRAAATCHGRYTAALLDQTGAQVSNRFSVYMAQTGA